MNVIGGKFIFFVGVGTILYGIAKVIEHEINYRNATEEKIKTLEADYHRMKDELELASKVIDDFK